MEHRRAFRSLAADASRVPLIVALLAVITAVACAVEDSGGCVGGCVLPAVGEGGCMRVRTSASLSACRGRSSAPPSPTATRPTPRRRQTAPRTFPEPSCRRRHRLLLPAPHLRARARRVDAAGRVRPHPARRLSGCAWHLRHAARVRRGRTGGGGAGVGEEEGRGRAPGWAATIRRSARGNTHDQFGAAVSLRLACSRSITRACGCECDRHSGAPRSAQRLLCVLCTRATPGLWDRSQARRT